MDSCQPSLSANSPKNQLKFLEAMLASSLSSKRQPPPVPKRSWRMLLVVFLAGIAADCCAQAVDLRDQRRDGDVTQVKITFDAKGELSANNDGKTDAPLKTAMAVKAQVVYVERLLRHTDPASMRSVRIFESAMADVVVGAERETTLFPYVKQTLVTDLIDKRIRVWSPTENLTRRDLDVIQGTHYSLAVDRLLPEKAIQPGETWEADSEVLAAILQLDHVGINDSQLQFVDVQKGMARIQLAGKVKGRVDGVLTEVAISGDCRFDTRWKRVTWLQLQLHETREQSATSPALDVTSELRMLIEPPPASQQLVTQLPTAIAEPNAKALFIKLVSKDAGFETLHTRDWIQVEERQRQLTLRWADEDKAIAQLTISRLKDENSKRTLSLQEFERDIQKALGDKFGQFERSNEVDRGDGYKILRVPVLGVVNEVPIRWVYYHVTSPNGYRVSLTFTMGSQEERAAELAEHERQFLVSLRLGPAIDSKQPMTVPQPEKEQARFPSTANPVRSANQGNSALLPRR